MAAALMQRVRLGWLVMAADEAVMGGNAGKGRCWGQGGEQVRGPRGEGGMGAGLGSLRCSSAWAHTPVVLLLASAAILAPEWPLSAQVKSVCGQEGLSRKNQ